MRALLRTNLVLLVILAIGLGAAKVAGLAPQRALYDSIGLGGAALTAFGAAQVGAGILIASLPTRRIGAGIFIASLVVTMLAFHQAQAPLHAVAVLSVLAMPGLVLSATPPAPIAMVARPRRA